MHRWRRTVGSDRGSTTLRTVDAAHDRFLRQIQLPRFGAEGQSRLARARVLVAGCGALGTVVCEQLARAGVGTLVVVDRDVVELSNLQRQTLFTEADARRGVPKAEAAKSRLAQVNAGTVVRAFVDDIHGGNARRYVAEVDLVVDCLDNFETRYVLNDCAVERGIALVYGGAVAMRGMAAALLPVTGADGGGLVRWDRARATPCLRCLAPDGPAPGEVETCETAGILAAAASVTASIEAALAIRLVAEGAAHVPPSLVRFDLGSMEFSSSSLVGARDGGCVCCAARRFEFLADGDAQLQRWRVLCGRGAVEVALGAPLEANAIARAVAKLSATGVAHHERHGATDVVTASIKTEPWPDGSRSPIELALLSGAAGTFAIVSGTTDPERARSLVSRYLGV
jgi:molybdopterin/thiamine biosynthesis adenylyltransferase